MSTVRRQGQLVQQQDNPLDRNATSTPAGAAATGASPDSAKMQGSRLERKNAINEAVDPNKSQQAVQRDQQFQTAGATAGQQDATSLGARLQRVSGLNDRVDSLVKDRLAAASTGTAVNFSAGGDMYASLDPSAQQAIMAYTEAIQNGASEADISVAYERMATAVQAASGNGATFDPSAYLQQIEDNLASTYTESAGIQSTYKLGELKGDAQSIEEALEYEGDLATDLGITPEELVELSIEDVQDRIKTIQEEEFSQVEALRTELATASPDRKQEILEELRNLSSAGMTGAEDTVEGLQSQIESAQEIIFAGNTFTLKDLLEDDVISSVIKSAAVNPDLLQELMGEEPELAAWIEQNKGALEDLAKTSEGATEGFRELQETFQKDFEGFELSTLANLLGKTEEELGFVSQEELTALQEAAKASSVFSAAQGNPELKQAIAELDPEILADLNGLPQADVEEAFTMAQDIKNNQQLRDIVGDVEGNFLLDPNMRDNVEKTQGILSILKNSDVIGTPEFTELVKNGTIDEDEAKYIAENPGEYNELVDWYKLRKETNNIGDMSDATKVLFGKSTDLDNINSQMDSLREKSKYGHTEARRLLAKMEEWFGKTADANDFTSIKDKLSKLVGTGSDPLKVMQDNLNKFTSQDGLMNTNLGDAPPLYKKIRNLLDAAKDPQGTFDKVIADGKISSFEARNYPDHLVEELMTSGTMPYKEGKDLLDRRNKARLAKEQAIADKRLADRTPDVYDKYIKTKKDLDNVNYEVLLNEGFSQAEAKKMVHNLKKHHRKMTNKATSYFEKYGVESFVMSQWGAMDPLPKQTRDAYLGKIRSAFKSYPSEMLEEILQKHYRVPAGLTRRMVNKLMGRKG